ncbi:hypothetical protein J7643_17255 [bacterium]|nr:hypothetical protein [bacterium]
MQKNRILALLVAATAVIAGCKPPALVSTGMPGAVSAPAQELRQTLDNPRLISGLVEFPARREAQATSADVVNASTLQLIDTSTNLTVVSGVMTNGGTGNESFTLTIPSTFAPAVGQTFLLEAVKGLGSNAPGNEALRLRTIVQWTANGWTSITGNASIVLTAMTTAVSIISSVDPGNVPPAQTIGDVTYSLGNSTFTGALPGHTAAEVNNLTASVKTFISGNTDPVANVGRITPQVTGLTVNRGAIGDVVAVFGDGFSPVTGAATVSFNGANAGTYLVRSRTALYVVVPSGATTGNVTVTTVNGTSNGMPFTVSTPGATTITPVITALSRNVVRRGDTLTLLGYNYDANYLLNTVSLNGSPLAVTGGNASYLTATIPNDATSGPITVTNVNGTSGAFYLGVLTSAPKSIVEAFANTATRDAAVTNLDWSNTGALNYPALVNWSESGNDFSKVNSAAATTDTFVNTAPRSGVAMQRTVNSNAFTNVGIYDAAMLPSTAMIATNGDVLLGSDASFLYSIKIKSLIGDRGQEITARKIGYPFLNDGGNVYLGLAGLTGSDVFYYLNNAVSQTSVSSLRRIRVTDYGWERLPDLPLPFTINRYSTYSYGHRIGSNGQFLYIWGGQSTGNTVSTGYVYRFAVNGDTMALVDVKAFNGNAYDSSSYLQITADDQYMFMPYTSPMTTQLLHQTNYNAYSTGFSIPFHRSSYASYFQMAYDSKNDCYWAVNQPNANAHIEQLVRGGATYTTIQGTAHVTSPAISLPNGQVWDKVSYSGTLAPNTTIRLDVLKASDNSVLTTLPASALNSTTSVRSALANHSGAIKLRAWLDTTNGTFTPYLTSWGITSAWPGQVLAQSNGYDTGVASGLVTYLSHSVDQPDGAPPVTIQFSDSANGATWGPWTGDVSRLSRRYVRWQIVAPVPTTFSGPLVKRVQIDYQH